MSFSRCSPPYNNNNKKKKINFLLRQMISLRD